MKSRSCTSLPIMITFIHLPLSPSVSYQGPIYAHGEGPAPIPPQGMLVQPEMHIPHPGQWSRPASCVFTVYIFCTYLSTSSSGLHPHQSGGPIADPTLYGGPPVSLSPGQPQQLLPPPFYPPPGVMTFPYPTMYPSPQVNITCDTEGFVVCSGAPREL